MDIRNLCTQIKRLAKSKGCNDELSYYKIKIDDITWFKVINVTTQIGIVLGLNRDKTLTVKQIKMPPPITSKAITPKWVTIDNPVNLDIAHYVQNRQLNSVLQTVIDWSADILSSPGSYPLQKEEKIKISRFHYDLKNKKHPTFFAGTVIDYQEDQQHLQIFVESDDPQKSSVLVQKRKLLGKLAPGAVLVYNPNGYSAVVNAERLNRFYEMVK